MTTAQAALMLMKALGYFQYNSDFGADWQLSTVRQGNDIDLFIGVDSGVEQAMTRNDVAQLVLNTLKAGTVQAETNGSLTVGNVTIATDVKYSYVTSNQTYATAIDDARSTSSTTDAGRSIVELGEQLYMGDLQLNDNTHDVFGRPARYWEYEGDEIGTYAKTELLKETYTTEVTGRDLYDLLGKATIEDYDFAIYVDGETDEDILEDAYFTEGNLVRSNTNSVGETGNGVLTEVYVDTTEHEVTIAIINTYLAVTDDYDDDDDEVDLEIYSVEDKGRQNDRIFVKNTDDEDGDPYTVNNVTVAGEDFDIADYVDGDVVLVTVADGEVQTLADPEVISDAVVDAFRLDRYVETDGTQYNYADVITYDPEVLDQYDDANMKDVTYNLYLDPYGYLVGIEQNEDPDQYLFLVGMDTSASNFSGTTADANVIFMDGTMATIEINTRRSENAEEGDLVDGASATMNTWCKYTVNNQDVYTLTEVDGDIGNDDVAQNHDTVRTEIDRSHISLTGAGNPARVYGNDETVYLVAETEMINSDTRYDVAPNNDTNHAAVIDDVTSVVTGVENADIEVFNRAEVIALYDDPAIVPSTGAEDNISYGVYALYDDEAYVVGAVVVGEDAGSTSNFVYVISDNANRESYSSADDEYTWTRTVVLDGEETEISYVGDSLDEIGQDNMDQGFWYYVRYYADGTVKETTKITDQDVVNSYDIEDSMLDAVAEIDADPSSEHVLLNNANENDLTFQSGSLYSATTDNEGIWISPEVMVVRIQTVDGDDFDEIEYYEGRDGLEDALEDMRVDADDHILVSAIIEDGAAMVVILNNTNDDVTDEGDTGHQNANIASMNVALSGDRTDLWLNLLDRNGDKVTEGSVDYTIYWRSGSQGSFDVFETGTKTCAEIAENAIVEDIPANSSWYIVVSVMDDSTNTVTRI